MVLESTVICVDNSDYMRNGDFVPTRMQAQQDAVNLICHSKTRSNPENNVGLLSLSDTVEVLVTLTQDSGKVLARLHQVQPNGLINFVTGVRIAHLVLKHRQGRNHKMRIVIFVGSPVNETQDELNKLAKRLKKEKVNIDVINFGEQDFNTDKLDNFIKTINGKDGTGSHLVTVAPGRDLLSDALVSSAVIVGEDGSGAVASGGGAWNEFGFDANDDPELAMALRLSMEEQRAMQDEDTRRAQGAAAFPNNLDAMTEEEQIAWALRMSQMDDNVAEMDVEKDTPATESEEKPAAAEAETKNQADEEMTDLADPEFLRDVLSGLEGVDGDSKVIEDTVKKATEKKDDDASKK